MTYLKITFAIMVLCRNFSRLLANRIFTKLGFLTLAPEVREIELYSGQKFSTGPRRTLGASDLFLIWEIWREQPYSFGSNPGMWIQKTDTVLDVGANKGYFSIFAAIQAKAGRVFAFEPEPYNYRLLLENLKLNNITNVVAEELAISTKKEQRDLYLMEGNEGGHSFYQKTTNMIKVTATDLLSYVKEKQIERVNFLKLDCEGEEYEIIASLPDEFWAIVDKISLEYHPLQGHSDLEIIRTLRDKNFRILEHKRPFIKAIKRQ